MLARSLIKRSDKSFIRSLGHAPANSRVAGLRTSLRLQSHLSIREGVARPAGRVRVPSGLKQIGLHQGQSALFHSTPPRNALLILGALKASTGLQIVKTAARIALTFLPLILLKNLKNRHQMKHPAFDEKKAALESQIKMRTRAIQVLLLGPMLLFWATILASLERTPLTGRWRLILLSPEEEVEIAAQLAGKNWYTAVSEILTTPTGGTPKALPYTDWRYIWVRDTLRQLEKAIPILQREHELEPRWLEEGGIPLPPPSEYPLVARARVSKWMCEMSKQVTDLTDSGEFEHQVIPGPPYSLVVVDDPNAANAFSYGFGAGGAGIVVYSGFLDEILSKGEITDTNLPPTESRSWLSQLFGESSRPPSTQRPAPTPEQTAELAILLAHELSHLVLAHHLETLSSGTIIIPGIMSMVADIARTILFPFTMMFGPFVNDAVAQLTKIGTTEFTKIGEYCTSAKQEIEADVASVRILAYAGFDARDAVSFWDTRTSDRKAVECSATRSEETSTNETRLAHFARGDFHPLLDARVDSLRKELNRWELERRVARNNATASPSILNGFY